MGIIFSKSTLLAPPVLLSELNLEKWASPGSKGFKEALGGEKACPHTYA